MSELRTIDKFPISKQEIEDLSSRLIAPVLDGEVDPTEQVIKLKGVQEAVKKALDDDRIKDSVLSDIEKYGKERSWNGAKVAIKEVGVTYDFSECNDPILDNLQKQKAWLDEQIKAREKFLKNLTEKYTHLDEETGEVFTIYPAIKQSRQGYSITFKK